MTYSINGRAEQPRVGVNPVSALTPGILRRIFEPVRSSDAGGSHSWQPDAEVQAVEMRQRLRRRTLLNLRPSLRAKPRTTMQRAVVTCLSRMRLWRRRHNGPQASSARIAFISAGLKARGPGTLFHFQQRVLFLAEGELDRAVDDVGVA